MMDKKELLKIIEQAARDGRTELNLSYKGIESLPAKIGQLENLTKLNLGGNSLSVLPAEIGNLRNLSLLDLNNNQLKTLSSEIGNLKKLTTLILNENRLSSLPMDIGNIKNLTKVYLHCNQLTSLPAEIGDLRNLTTLVLSKNRLTSLPQEIRNWQNMTDLRLGDNRLDILSAEIGYLKNLIELRLSNNQLVTLPPEIGSLKKLTILELANNQLTEISAILGLTNLRQLDLTGNRITEFPRQVVDLRLEINWQCTLGTDGIFLQGNPLEKPPIEIIKQETEALRNYFEAVEKERSQVFEAKLLIVGEGGVGKTSLMKRLMAPDEKIDHGELTTEGIEINQWIMGTDRTEDFRVNFWDFGGQEIYHATHQFFLTKRSLYLFVWTARTDDDLISFDYWLNVVKLLSDNSPVIVVLNKIDERTKSIDEQSVQAKFENVVCFDRVSALENTGIDSLAENIRQQIARLPHIGTVLPTAWIDIRMRLENLDMNYISFDEYRAICSEFSLDEAMAEFLSRYYHDLGVFLHFLDNAILREIVFLKLYWFSVKRTFSTYG